MHPLIQQILDLVEKIKTKFDELMGKVNDFLGWIPWGLGWLADKIESAWNGLVDKWNEFWDGCELIFGNMGDPDSIQQVSNEWNNDVGGPVSAQAGKADRALLAADDHWEGQAAASYFPKSALHKTALEAVQNTFATGFRTALDSVRSGLVKFYMGLVTALGALVVGFIGALASSATIFGIPAGILIAAGACLVAIGAFYTGGTLLKSDCTTAQTQLTNTMNTQGPFPGGQWPPGAILTA